MACSKTTARCVPPKSYYKKDLPECCRQQIVSIFSTIRSVFLAHDIQWWLDYGSLLGAVRNPLHGLPPGIIAHDKDGDIGVFGTDFEKVRALKSEFEDAGLYFLYKEPRLNHILAGGHHIKISWSVTNGNCVDIFPWYEKAGNCYRTRYIGCDRNKGREFPKNKLLPLQERLFEGVLTPVPNDPEWFVQHRYGKDWMTPIRRNNDGVKR